MALLVAGQATAPTQTVNYLYDGSGARLATQSTANGTTTLTSYIGSLEEVQTTGSSTQTTTYYAVGSTRVAADVNGTFYYFGYDARAVRWQSSMRREALWVRNCTDRMERVGIPPERCRRASGSRGNGPIV